MKRTFLTLLALLLVMAGVSAQTSKVVERSDKKPPQWLLSPPQDALLVEVEAPDMSAARDKAVDEIARRIIMAVAANVVHGSTASATHEDGTDGLREKESFSYDTRIAAARIPFIQGISLTEALGTYWEKCREDKSDRIFYRYAVLYPLPATKLQQMRTEFEKEDSEKNDRLCRLEAGLGTVTSASGIEQAVTCLDELREYFFDDVRKRRAEGLLANYRRLYKSLTMEASKPEGGRFTVSLRLDGRPFRADGLPTLKSNCAARLQAAPLPEGTGFEITFDDTDCLPEEDNWIEINLRMRDTRLTQKVYF